jgi:hypothetical protein
MSSGIVYIRRNGPGSWEFSLDLRLWTPLGQGAETAVEAMDVARHRTGARLIVVTDHDEDHGADPDTWAGDSIVGAA